MENNKLTKEMIEKAKAAKSPEGLLALAKENDVELTAEQANAYFAKLCPHNGELADEELDNVAGGGCSGEPVKCPHCGSTNVETKSDGYYEGTHFIRTAFWYVCQKCRTSWE